MSNRRLGVGVTVTGGCLHAVGGSDGAVPLASVERYVKGLGLGLGLGARARARARARVIGLVKVSVQQTLLNSYCSDGVLYELDISTGTVLRSLKGHSLIVTAISVQADN